MAETYVTSYKEVSAELGKKLIKLYNAKIFPRQGKIFADMLFQSGIEAGSYLAALADIEERNVKINLGTNALIQLNQTEYLLAVMLDAGYYTPIQVLDLQEYLVGLTQAISDLLVSAYAQMNSENMHTVVASAPIQSLPARKPKAEKPKPTPPPVIINADPDGFNIIAKNADNENKTDNNQN